MRFTTFNGKTCESKAHWAPWSSGAAVGRTTWCRLTERFPSEGKRRVEGRGSRVESRGSRRYLHWCRAKPGHCSPQAAQGCPLCGSSAGFGWRQTGGAEVSEDGEDGEDGGLPEYCSAACRQVSLENICLFIHSLVHHCFSCTQGCWQPIPGHRWAPQKDTQSKYRIPSWPHMRVSGLREES